jgi:hypothetical protein
LLIRDRLFCCRVRHRFLLLQHRGMALRSPKLLLQCCLYTAISRHDKLSDNCSWQLSSRGSAPEASRQAKQAGVSAMVAHTSTSLVAGSPSFCSLLRILAAPLG